MCLVLNKVAEKDMRFEKFIVHNHPESLMAVDQAVMESGNQEIKISSTQWNLFFSHYVNLMCWPWQHFELCHFNKVPEIHWISPLLQENICKNIYLVINKIFLFFNWSMRSIYLCFQYTLSADYTNLQIIDVIKTSFISLKIH